jgi:ABC-type multidrug transport system fused ATPase/permease subunit
VFSIILIWRLIGWPCLFGILTVVIGQGLNALIARALIRWEKVRRSATDSKLKKVSQFVEAIRHLRWYGWQNSWLKEIMEARQQELNIRIITSIWNLLIAFTNALASGLFPVTAFYAYTILAGLPLRVDIAFPALQLFNILEQNLRGIPDLITVLINASVAVGRIEAFMHEPDKPRDETASDSAQLELKDASFAWPGVSKNVLNNITLDFPVGLTVIFGEVAAGKSALLQALLGELDKTSGDLYRPDEMTAFCAQTPWLQSMSIRDNILFFSPYDEIRYKQVLDACALVADMANFKHGDLSEIGENGIGLSGGQRARVALARAVYSISKIVLLDDPLSALDHQTAESIVRKCIAGPLLEDRTVVLVTHRVDVCRGVAEQMVELKDGRATILDPTIATNGEQNGKTATKANDAEEAVEKEPEAETPEKFMDEEHRAHGGVKVSVYWEYIKAGKLIWWFFMILALGQTRLIHIGKTWFLKAWGEGYDETGSLRTSGFFDSLPRPEDNPHPWLIGFFILSSLIAFSNLITQSLTIIIVYTAGKNMFADVMNSVSHATFRFYDVTPVGRLMNRLTSDISTIDGNISSTFKHITMLAIMWISSVVIIASVTPVFMLLAVVFSVAFVLIFLKFLPTSQSLRRLEVSCIYISILIFC